MIDRLAAAPVAVQAVMLVGLVARATLLVVADRITATPRTWLQARLPVDGYLRYLTWCPACVGVHAAWMTTLAWVRWPGPTLVVALAATAALIAAPVVHALAGDTEPDAPPPAPHG